MKTPPTFVAVIALASWSIAACSSAVEPPPHADGYVAGGTQTGSSQGAGSSSSAPTGSSGGGSSSGSSGGSGPTGSSSGGGGTATDAGSSPPVTPVEAGTADSGSGYFIDTGSPVNNPAPSGPPGSCTNPLCGSDGNECGCTATDSNGNTIQLGCQAGGECGCFENQQLTDQPFPENGTCNDPTLPAQEFLQYCTCN